MYPLAGGEMAVGSLAHSSNWKKAGVDGARETIVQGQAEVKTSRTVATSRILVLTLPEKWNIWRTLSYAVTWTVLCFGRITQTTAWRPGWRESEWIRWEQMSCSEQHLWTLWCILIFIYLFTHLLIQSCILPSINVFWTPAIWGTWWGIKRDKS